MTPKQYPFERGFFWLKESFALFMRAPLMWIVLLASWFLISMVLASVPILGGPLVNLLAPVFVAGMMVGCRDLYDNKSLEITHLFDGFKHNGQALITIGGIYMAGVYLVVFVMGNLGMNRINDALIEALKKDPNLNVNLFVMQMAQQNSEDLFLPAVVGLSLFFMLFMLLQFSPMLVRLKDVSPFESIRLNIVAVAINAPALTAYSAVFMLLALPATLLFGIGWVVLLPMIVTASYVIYYDIFVRE